MADLKNYVMAVIAILFVATVSVSVYSTALAHNVANGGNSTNTAFPMLNQTQAFTNRMSNFSTGLSKSTYAASSTQDWVSALAGGIGAITQAGTGAISLTFGAIGVLIDMMMSLMFNSTMFGIPGWVITFGIMAITTSIVFAVLGALYKWWI